MTTAASRGVSGRALWIVIALGIVAFVATLWVAHRLIDQVYAGNILSGVLENRGEKPIEYYYEAVDRLVYAGYGLLALLAAVWVVAGYRSAAAVLGVLLFGDVIFFILSETYGGLLDIRLDGGIPEFYQYAKEVGIAVILLRLFRATGRRIFVGFGVLFAFLFVDDALKYHERMGRVLGGLPGMEALGNLIGVRAVDIGELVSVAPVLLALIAFLAVPYLRESADGRQIVHRFGIMIAALIAVGGFVDLIDRIAVTRAPDLVRTIGFFEDGGEMVIMSGMLAYALTLWWNRSHVATEARRHGDRLG
jgi:hypothetical protein